MATQNRLPVFKALIRLSWMLVVSAGRAIKNGKIELTVVKNQADAVVLATEDDLDTLYHDIEKQP